MKTNTFQSSFETKGGNSYDITLQFPEGASSGGKKQTPLNKKYNLLVRQEDLILLEKMQSAFGVSRTALLNNLLSNIMEQFLFSYNEGDARIAIAQWADDKSGLEGAKESWVETALKPDTLQIQRNYETYNTSYDQCPDHNHPEQEFHSKQYLAIA